MLGACGRRRWRGWVHGVGDRMVLEGVPGVKGVPGVEGGGGCCVACEEDWRVSSGVELALGDGQRPPLSMVGSVC
jgi:hypothetical protein